MTGRKSLWNPDRDSHRGFLVKCVPMYWELTFRNRDGLEGDFEGVYRRNEIRVFHQDVLSPLGMGTESEERP